MFRPGSGTVHPEVQRPVRDGPTQCGLSSDMPVSADYDNDDISDPAVLRPSTGTLAHSRVGREFLDGAAISTGA